MKSAFIAATVAAHCHDHHCQKNWKVYALDALYKPLTGGHIQDMCEVKPQPMHNGVFWRKVLRETHVTGVEALYGEQGIIEDECFGDWMDTAWDPVHQVITKVRDDFFTVSYDEWQNSGQALLDMGFKLEDTCHFEKIGDDIKTWCLGNEATCFNLAGVFDRVFENIFPMIENYVDAFHLLTKNDICSTDEELIQQYATMYGDICKNVVIVHGMEPLTWNKDLQLDHINQTEFHNEKKAWKAAHQSWGK